MPKGAKNIITRCVGLRKDQIEWYEDNDVNFSKLVRRLVDNEIKRRELDNDVDLFEYVKGLVVSQLRVDHLPRTNFDNIDAEWVKDMVTMAIVHLNRDYTYLTRQERLVLERVGIDTGLGADEWDDQIPKGL